MSDQSGEFRTEPQDPTTASKRFIDARIQDPELALTRVGKMGKSRLTSTFQPRK